MQDPDKSHLKTCVTYVTEEGGIQPPVRTTLNVPTTQTAIESDTATTQAALQDAVSDARMRVITAAWDEMVIPPMPDGPDEEVYPRYIQTLKDALKDLAQRSNMMEGAAQSLAEANVRQTKIIAKLRNDLHKYQLKWLKEVQAAEDHEA